MLEDFVLISVIIPFYKGNDTLPRVFRALGALELLPSDRLEIVIALDGNGQMPDPAAWSSFPWPVQVYRQEQKGQSSATNLAARLSTGDMLWLLAQDMEPLPNALIELQRRNAKTPGCLIQGHIEHHPEMLKDELSRYIALESNFQFAFHAFKEPDNLKPGQHYSPHALVERQKFLVLGGYDEQLPYGFQDADFGLKWRLNGDKIIYAPESIALHAHAYTWEGYCRRQYNIGRSAVDFFIKWNQRDYLSLYFTTLIEFETRQQPNLKMCEEVVQKWLETGTPGTLPQGFKKTDPNESDLTSAFFLLLGWEYLRGLRERIEEYGYAGNMAPESLKMADGKWPHPYSWVDKLAIERARPRH